MRDEALEQFIQAGKTRFLDQLFEWLRIPSISSSKDRAQDVASAANWYANHLKDCGLENAKLIHGDGHPIVYADWLRAGEDRPTVLIYGHYDVQPPEPLELWTKPPFDPWIRKGTVGEEIVARGASDDKGQVFALTKALEACLVLDGALPVNVKILIEGEEEAGSHHLADYLATHREFLSVDSCLVADTAMHGPGKPNIALGLRGIWAGELVVSGPAKDIHSGVYGGTIQNPCQALAALLATMHDSSGRVTVSGFYDDVVELDRTERDRLASSERSTATWLEETGAPAIWGETCYTPRERTGIRPTLEFNGIYGGDSDRGFKTIIPARAGAKITCRLVPNQLPEKIEAVLFEHVRTRTPASVTSELTTYARAPAVVMSSDGPGITAAQRACVRAFGAQPVLSREGGGIPVVGEFVSKLGVEVVLLGYGLPDDGAHGPDEKFSISCLNQGICCGVYFLQEISRTL
ncbi:MAG: dipeptidase [Myxococcota bacterium]|nr:dipeptidase [Myxococcota bacterium]